MARLNHSTWLANFSPWRGNKITFWGEQCIWCVNYMVSKKERIKRATGPSALVWCFHAPVCSTQVEYFGSWEWVGEDENISPIIFPFIPSCGKLIWGMANERLGREARWGLQSNSHPTTPKPCNFRGIHTVNLNGISGTARCKLYRRKSVPGDLMGLWPYSADVCWPI